MKPNLKDLFNSSRLAVKTTISQILENLVFPWYEAKTGSYTSSKALRNLVAEKLEQDLSAQSWGLVEDYLQAGFITSPEFLVSNVFPQSTGNGNYDLVVVLCEKTYPQYKYSYTLQEFIQNFYPSNQLTFSDHDA